MTDDSLVLRLMLISGLSVAGAGAILAGIIYLFVRGRRGAVKVSNRALRPEGNGVAVLAAIGLFILFGWGASVFEVVLIKAGFFRELYGAGFPVDLPENATAAQKAAATIRHLWSMAFCFPLQLMAIAWLPRLLHIANPFHARDWPMAVVGGYLTWLIVTPAAFSVFVLASIGHLKLTGQEPEKHPLTALGDLAGTLEWGLFVLQTVVIAPILEEWLFRGMLLPWLAQKRPVPPPAAITIAPRRRTIVVLLAAVVIGATFTIGTSALNQPDVVRRAFSENIHGAAASYLIPTAFFLALVPVDLVLDRFKWVRRHLRIRSTQHLRAIWASACLFAAVHAHVWPSPVPLVVLALGLGYLYLRTRSLVGPIVVHAMFNAVSALYLVLGGPS